MATNGLNGIAPREAPSSLLRDQFGAAIPPTDDPAWQPPTDPLADGGVANRMDLIHREIPLSVVVTGWDVPMARAAKNQLVIGLFEQPAQMWDAIIMSDARVQSGLASRLSILGRPVSFRLPKRYRDSALAKECLDAWEEAWPAMATEGALGELQRWAIGLGFGIAQLLWDTSGEYAIPHPLPWHPRYSYYHWLYRCYVAITQDGQEPIIPGDASWLLHAPSAGGVGTNYGYRAWMRGSLGAITPWWLGRAYALRDWMRYSERHGLPMIKLKTPAVGDPRQQAIVRFQVAHLGQETVFHLPQNPPPGLSYDIELLEAKDTAHDGFRKLIEQCSEEITLALQAQTLTTDMPAEGNGSFAAARVHAGVRQGLLEADARALSRTIYSQIARPFAMINFGSASLAPEVVWDVTPYEDAATKADAFQKLAGAISQLRAAGFKLNAKAVRRMMRNTIPGFDPGKLEEIDPVAIAAADVRAKATEDRPEQKPPPGAAADMSRLSRLMSRMDPKLSRLMRTRAKTGGDAFLDGKDDGLRKAMAWAAEGA